MHGVTEQQLAAMQLTVQHRRVSELLANYIPEDEAKLLSNGRLTCLVCSQRPIFDTIAVLSMHRKGKKHLSELSKYLARKQELNLRKVKDEHKSYLQTGSITVKPEPPVLVQHKLLAHSVLYSSCCRRRDAKCGQQRKPALDVACLQGKSHAGTTLKEEGSIGLPSANSQVRRYLKDLWKKKPLEKKIQRCRENLEGTVGGIENFDTESTPVNTPVKTIEIKTSSGKKIDPAAEREAAYSLQLKMSGWLKDSNGCWIKNPEAEFDSDEDEPPPPPS